MSRITMADVAAALGVHPTTVSMALRGHHRIPAVTRERVVRKAREMGYRPNPLVSALIAERKKGRIFGKGSTLAFLTSGNRRDSWRISPNYIYVHERLIHHARARGYQVEDFWLKEPGMSPERLREILLYRGIRGIAVAPLLTRQQHLDFDFSEFATVALGLTLHDPVLDRVAVDYFSMMHVAVQRLLELGHQRIGFVTNSLIDIRVNHQSLGAFLAERHVNPRALVPPLAVDGWRAEPVKKWVHERKPDAVITPIRAQYTDTQRWLVEDGFRVPADVSVVCLDCLWDSKQSGMVQNLDLEAAAAVDWVTSRVERAQFGIPVKAQTLLVDGVWQDGNTVAPRAKPAGRRSPGPRSVRRSATP